MTQTNLPNEPKKILIIEDEGDICLLLNLILKGEQTDLDHVNTLSKAKLWLRENTPDLVFLDNSLPDGRGLGFIEYIKMHCPTSKIVMITAYHSASEKDLAMEHGADVFLEKPFTKSQIQATVQQLLEIDLSLSAE